MSVHLMSVAFSANLPDTEIPVSGENHTVKASTLKFVLLALADHANDEGRGAYPSIDTLAKKTSMSRRTVQRALDALIQLQIIKCVGTSEYGTDNYSIFEAAIYRGDSGTKAVGGVTLGQEGGDSGAVKSVPESPESSLKPSINQRNQKKLDLVDGLMFYSEQAKARGEDAVEGVLNALERLLHRNIQRSGQWQDLARWMLKRKESEPYQKWAEWYMADAFQAKTSWRLTPDQVRACWPQAFAAPEPAADDARYKPYTAENSMTFIKPEEAKEWERKWHLKKRQAEQLDKLPTAP